jgi:RHS repeat-associated protein
LALYDYNGAGSRLAMATYPQPSFKLDHFEGTSGTYAGLDRFGRIVDQYWVGFGGVSNVDRIHYAYDYAGGRTYRQIDPAIYPTENLDQAYTYDALHRLLSSQVGTLSGTTISGTPASEEDWTLDGLGNWPGYVQKLSGTVTLNQTRTASPANEVSGISASVGATWATPAYDFAGNMTTIPVPTNLTSTFTAIYDAWNRLTSCATGSTTVATYSYDGLNHRIVKGIYVSGLLDHNEHSYFNETWQTLEVRKESGGVISSNPLEQFVWHPFYIDSGVLRDYDAATSGSPSRYFYAFDANYNVTSVTTAAGVPAERYGYGGCGQLTIYDAAFSPRTTSALGNSHTYTGQPIDVESGLYSYRYRSLHSPLGVFITRDPYGTAALPSAQPLESDDLNLYTYVSNDPPDRVDPLGLLPNCKACEAVKARLNNTVVKSPDGQRKCTIKIDCKGKDAGCDGHLGKTDPGRPISICLTCSDNQIAVDILLAHELDHARRYCGSGGRKAGCAACVDDENKAYDTSCRLAKAAQPPLVTNIEQCKRCGRYLSCKEFCPKMKDPCPNKKPCSNADLGLGGY